MSNPETTYCVFVLVQLSSSWAYLYKQMPIVYNKIVVFQET